jgi:hypothetical protein
MASCPKCGGVRAVALPGMDGWFLYCGDCQFGWNFDGSGTTETPTASAPRRSRMTAASTTHPTSYGTV